MTFNVTADAYARFMGRYSEPLAVQFAELAGAQAGHRALDVGCGPGALTTQLVERLGAEDVSAIDPSPSFVAATRARFPGATCSSVSPSIFRFLTIASTSPWPSWSCTS